MLCSFLWTVCAILSSNQQGNVSVLPSKISPPLFQRRSNLTQASRGIVRIVRRLCVTKIPRKRHLNNNKQTPTGILSYNTRNGRKLKTVHYVVCGCRCSLQCLYSNPWDKKLPKLKIILHPRGVKKKEEKTWQYIGRAYSVHRLIWQEIWFSFSAYLV